MSSSLKTSISKIDKKLKLDMVDMNLYPVQSPRRLESCEIGMIELTQKKSKNVKSSQNNSNLPWYIQMHI